MRRRVSHGRQQSVGGGRTDKKEALTDLRVERQMAMSFESHDQTAQNRFKSFYAYPVSRFPEDDQGFTHWLVVYPSINRTGFERSGADVGNSRIARLR